MGGLQSISNVNRPQTSGTVSEKQEASVCICYPGFVIVEEVNGIVRPLIKVDLEEQEVDLMSSSPLSSQCNMLAILVLTPLCLNLSNMSDLPQRKRPVFPIIAFKLMSLTSAFT